MIKAIHKIRKRKSESGLLAEGINSGFKVALNVTHKKLQEGRNRHTATLNKNINAMLLFSLPFFTS